MKMRLHPLESLTGPANMATDELLLEQAVEGTASLRFYTWAEPTLSFGYFQPSACRFDNPRLKELAWLRRASGGGALVHHHELTYALALPPGKAWQTAEPNWTCRFHHIITTALKTVGITTRSVQCGAEQKLDPTLCFLHQTPGDLLADNVKVVGSAQRKQRGAILQHGGILLRQSEYTPELPGLYERTGQNITPEELAELITQQFTIDTGWTVVPTAWNTMQLQRRDAIMEAKYANPTWNEKR